MSLVTVDAHSVSRLDDGPATESLPPIRYLTFSAVCLLATALIIVMTMAALA
jgi:hypothetical protein